MEENVKVPTLSLCMIVKDEEAVLERCLESVKDIIDEFIIVDTGSTDSTKEIIAKYGTVYEEPFINFVKTKNASIEKATGDYILWMDADEILVDGADRIKAHMSRTVPVVVMNKMGGGTSYFKPRLWKNDPVVEWRGPNTHEYLHYVANTIYDHLIVIDEAPKKDKDMVGKFTRDVKLIHEFFDEDPKNLNEPRAYFYLAQSYGALGKIDTAIQYYLHYLDMAEATFKDEKLWSTYMLSQAYYKIGEVEMALAVLDKGISIDPHRAELYYQKGYISYYLQEWQVAADWFKLALKCEVPKNVVGFLEKDKYEDLPLDYLAICEFQLKNWDRAHELSKRLNNIRDNKDDRIKGNIEIFGKKSKMKIAMYMGYFFEPIYGGMLEEQGLGGVETTYIELARSFAKLGFEPYVFVSTTENHTHKGVHYVNYQEFDEYVKHHKFETYITSRHEYIFDRIEGGLKILWIQDINTFRMSEEQKAPHGQNKIVVSTNYHKNFLQKQFLLQYVDKPIEIIPITISKELYRDNIRAKDPYRISYSSSLDRGLFNIFEMWPEIIKRVPQATLHFYYGNHTMKIMDEEKYNKFTEIVNGVTTAYPDSVFNHDRVTKKQLAQDQMKSAVCLYPTMFYETFCLTAWEHQISGTPMIYNVKGALMDTVQSENNIPMLVDPTTKYGQEQYTNKIVELLGDVGQDKLISLQEKNRKWGSENIPTWDEIARRWKKLIFESV